MAYSTQDDILEQLPEADLIGLTDDAGIGEIDDGVVTRAIADADAMIDAYCQDQYEIPLSPVPAMVRRISVDLAIYNLLCRRDRGVSEVRANRQKEVVRFLEKVAAGGILLGATTPAPENTGNSVEVSANDRIFTRTTMEGF